LNNVILRVEAPQLPNYSGYEFPVLFACDASSTRVCVPGSQAIINGPPCTLDVAASAGVCPTVGVAPNTWGAMKKLYGE
jgi:hypothetical protein